MKLLFFLLVLTLAHEAASTHLETCECHKIKQMVNDKVEEAIEKLTNTMANNMERFIRPIQYQLNYHFPPPGPLQNSRQHPATSCNDLYWNYPQAPSGYYWIIKSERTAVSVYCSMNSTCGDERGGWMRVANIDTTNPSQSCPNGSVLITSPKRLCQPIYNTRQCPTNTFSTQGIQYRRVCGKIIGYQNKNPIGFYNFRHSIDDIYVHGVSLTHGQSPRNHIWTFAGASDETSGFISFSCPCINSRAKVPSYVGDDYFCDAATQSYFPRSTGVNTTDPLWDGKGCGATNTCCSFNSPPWFVKELPSPTTDDIDMRVCNHSGNGNTPIEIVELYVQ